MGETIYYRDSKFVKIRVVAGDTVANGTTITEAKYDSNYPDYYGLLTRIEGSFDSILNKIRDCGIGTIYQVLDPSCSICYDIRDIISKKL